MEDLLPGEVDGIAVRDDLDDLAVNRDAISAHGLDISFEDAKGGVVLEEVGGLLDTAGVVDGNDVEGRVLAAMPAPQEVAADPAESVNGHLQLCLYHSLSVSTIASHLQTRVFCSLW